MPQSEKRLLRVLLRALKNFLWDRFDLHSDKERDSITISEITKGAEFKGANLWILIFAIGIASVGLNVNSPAVIIGAMLISPLMGPIMGVGLGAGINDFPLIAKSARNLAIAAIISVGTSALYFAITPLHEAQSELLARTYPTLYDVLIAFFGGLAGIVAGSRSQKSNAIPGVAIATALMPPLCTAGYGLANLNWYYFLGALFLFLINSVFISLSTFMIVRFLKYPRKQFDDPKTEKQVGILITSLVLITVVPSSFLAYFLVQESLFKQNARIFIEKEFKFKETQVITKEAHYSRDGNSINLTLYGKSIAPDLLEKIKSSMENYGLKECELIINQGYSPDPDQQNKAFEEYTRTVRTGIIEDLYRKNEEILKTKDERISFLENELVKMQTEAYPIEDITAELNVQYSGIQSLVIKDAELFRAGDNSIDTVCFALLSLKKKPTSTQKKKIEEWLKVRTKNDRLELIIR